MSLEEDMMSEDADLGTRVVSLEHRHGEVKSRLKLLETWQGEVNIAHARQEEKFNSMLVVLMEVKDSLRWVTRLIVGGIVAAAMAFITGGGLNILK